MDNATTQLLERATRRLFTRIMTGVARTLADEALTIGQIAGLFLVDDHRELRVADLAGQLALSQSATSRLVDGLVEQVGLVGRTD